MRVAVVAIVVSLGSTAHAQSIDPATLCHPARPVALGSGCTPIPPGVPPRLSQPEIDAVIAREDADVRAANAAGIHQDAQRRWEASRERDWRARAEAARPANIPVAFPSVEVGAGFTAGGIAGGSRTAKSYGHAGPELTLGFHLDGRYGVDVPISLLQTWGGVNGSWATLGFRPAFILSLTAKDVMLSVRGGPDVLVPLDAPRSTPSAFLGGHVGASVLFFAASLPNYGYVGFGFEMRAAVRAGVAGPPSPLDDARLGIDGSVLLKVGL